MDNETSVHIEYILFDSKFILVIDFWLTNNLLKLSFKMRFKL